MTAASGDCLAYGHHTLSSIRTSLSEDVVRYLNRWQENGTAREDFQHRASAFLTPSVLCLLFHRAAHCLYVNGWRRLARAVSRLNFFFHKVSITPQSCIGPGCLVPHPAAVSFHGRAGRELSLYSLAVCCPLEGSLEGPVETGPSLGDRVTVGAHAVLLGPITVGADTKIAFSVRLDRDAPPGMLVISRSLRQARRPILAGEIP